MPYIVSDEFFNGSFPSFLEQLFITHYFELIHKSFYVLDEDVITRDKHLFLLLLLSSSILRQLWFLRRLVFERLAFFLVHEWAFVGLTALNFVRAWVGWIDDTCQRSPLIREVIITLKAIILLRSLLVNCSLHTVRYSLESNWLFPFLIRSWLNLSCCTLWEILLGVLISVLVQLLVLFVSGRW